MTTSRNIFPEDLQAPSVLSKAGLAYFEPPRLRVLAPIREYMQAKHPPTPGDWALAIAHYSRLAREQGPLVGTAKGSKALERLADEVPNLDAVLQTENCRPPRAPGSDRHGARAQRFHALLGYGSLDILEQAREQARRLGDMNRIAQSTYTLGQLLLRRSEHARARELFRSPCPSSIRSEIHMAGHVASRVLAPLRSMTWTWRRRRTAQSVQFLFASRSETARASATVCMAWERLP